MLSPEAGVLALVAAGLALAMVRALAMRKIGGQTGDVCGAGQVMAETAMLDGLCGNHLFTLILEVIGRLGPA